MTRRLLHSLKFPGGNAMSHPRLTIGTYGEIMTRRRPSRRIEARARRRDPGGVARLVQVSGDTAVAATHALKAKCVDRDLIAPSAGPLAADSLFPYLVAYWLEDIEVEDRLAVATRQLLGLSMPSVRISGTIISPRGEPTAWQEHPKTARSRRTVQQTVATTINEHAGVELVSQLLGHADPAITINHYICRNEAVDPTTADLLEKRSRDEHLVIQMGNRYAVCVTIIVRLGGGHGDDAARSVGIPRPRRCRTHAEAARATYQG
ncbi:hypothetical protein [Microbacterium sp. A84]|uniref:hypothetical protein n=1 Tax=Microbacterium sp. A84 TaxID=3450715 RepID=UPI003F43E21F